MVEQVDKKKKWLNNSHNINILIENEKQMSKPKLILMCCNVRGYFTLATNFKLKYWVLNIYNQNFIVPINSTLVTIKKKKNLIKMEYLSFQRLHLLPCIL